MTNGPIRSASVIPLDRYTGSLHNMQGAMKDYFQTLTFTQVFKTVVNHEVMEDRVQNVFQGVKVPLRPQALAMKPEGQRAWRWFNIFAYPDLELKTDDVIELPDPAGGAAVQYRVMAKESWSEYGYVRYEIAEGFQE